MITVRFSIENALIVGFRVSGHAEAAPVGKDIVCAAVSSAAYMTANTITEVIGIKAEPTVSDGDMKLLLTESEATRSQELLKGFELHIRELKKQYPQSIRIIYGGYKNVKN